MKKKWLSIFCLLVFSFQLLPVRQIGSLLFNNGLTEELSHHGKAAEADSKDDLDFNKEFVVSSCGYHFSSAGATKEPYLQLAYSLPSPVHGDIHTPPPNCKA